MQYFIVWRYSIVWLDRWFATWRLGSKVSKSFTVFIFLCLDLQWPYCLHIVICFMEYVILNVTTLHTIKSLTRFGSFVLNTNSLTRSRKGENTSFWSFISSTHTYTNLSSNPLNRSLYVFSYIDEVKKYKSQCVCVWLLFLAYSFHFKFNTDARVESFFAILKHRPEHLLHRCHQTTTILFGWDCHPIVV